MKKLVAIMALVALTFAVQAGEGCGSSCPAGKDGKGKSEGTCPAGGEKKADDKKA